MFSLVILDDRPDIFDTLDGESLEERNHRDQLFTSVIPFRTVPRFQLNTVLGLELEVGCIGVEDDGSFERSVQVGKIFDQLLVLVSSRVLEQFPGNVSAVRIELLDDRCGGLKRKA